MAKKSPPPELRAYLSEIGKKGGKRRLVTMTKEQRQEIARQAGKKSAEARAKKARRPRRNSEDISPGSSASSKSNADDARPGPAGRPRKEAER